MQKHSRERDLDLLLKSLGTSVQQLRKARELTQMELGKLAGTSWMTINRLEAATAGTQIDRICRIAQALDVPVAHLFDEAQGKRVKRPKAVKSRHARWDRVKQHVDTRTSVEREWIAKVVETLLER